jgi:hypothetical protein
MARQMPRGGISFGGAELFVTAFAPGWDGIPVKADWYHSGQGPRSFEIRGAKTYFKGTSEWTRQPDGTVRGRVEMECVTPVELQCVAVAVDIPSPPPFGLGDASSASFDLPLADGRTVRLSFPQPVRYHSQDSRQWGGNWTVRFSGNGGHLGHGGTRSFEKGEHLVWEMALAAPDGFEIADSKPLDITANDDWVRLDYRKDIVPGSALDLSGQGLQDAPAGKHGWLKSVGGHFEFEKLPGVEQRFYGVNLCFTANYPDHEMADRLVDRFVRFGYNTIRVHHHDGAWAKALASRKVKKSESPESPRPSGPSRPSDLQTAVDVVVDDIDRLDYLLAKCFERGIYVTTDLYVSRSVKWRDIGIDRDGEMNKQLFKTYVGIHDGAYSNWCHWAQAFLEHVNPYTGRAYKDEPGLPLISLINEGKLSMAWGGAGKSLDPVVRAAWKEFGGEGDTPVGPGANNIDSPHDRFDLWVNRRVWDRCSAFVRSLGCRALLTNDNNGRWHGEGEGLTPLYDYVDSHFYVDHPTFLDQPWRLPSKCGNANPIKADLPAILHRGYAKGASKPYTITEWNFSGPGRYRGMGGILTGAMAAEQEWDGLWRFAYSHNKNNLPDGKGSPGYFDCGTDPLIAASDRASVCLFLEARKRQTDAVTSDERRVTSEQGAESRGAEASPSALTLDKERGSMTLVTPRTCGGFAESGRIDAGSLSFQLVESQKVRKSESQETPRPSDLQTFRPLTNGCWRVTPATIWASSLDGEPLERSSRILLTHLTDVQGEGARYADESRKVILKWGMTPLIEVGAADVELSLDEAAANHSSLVTRHSSLDGETASGFTVYALDTAGNRTGTIPAVFDGGTLRFRVSTAGPDGGRIYYEIVRTSGTPRTIEVSPVFGAGLSMPEVTLMPGVAFPGWTFKGSIGGLEADDDGWRAFRIRLSNDNIVPPLEGKAKFSSLGGNAISAQWNLKTTDKADLLETFVGGGIPGSAIAGGKAVVDGKDVPVLLDGVKPHLFRGAVTNLVLAKADGAELLRFAFDKPTRILLQDGAHWGGDNLTLRIFFAEGPLEADHEYAIGAGLQLGSAWMIPGAAGSSWAEPPPVMKLTPSYNVTIKAGPDWLPLANEPWIEPGSALDFSQVLPHHAPAGKFGRIVAVGDHFEFEKLPGVAQRFYGVNICGDANVPSSPEAADRFAANLARIGYNTLRIHHHERNLISTNAQWREGLDDTLPDPKRLDMFDSLVAACVKNGIYLTTDLFVSRSHLTTWRSLGIDRDGCISNTGHYKILCAFWEPAYSNLCAWSRNFMTHVNPYTGRSLAEEPALATLALINEGNLGNWGVTLLREIPGVDTAWRNWLAAKRADNQPSTAIDGKRQPTTAVDSSFDWTSIPDTLPDSLNAGDGSTPAGRHAAAFAIFLADMETRLADRLRAFVRDELNCKAPLSSLSCWYNPAQYQLPRTHFDYVDDHFYVDHPRFLDKSWALPSRCDNVNPVAGKAAGAKSVEWRRLMDKPFCLTEWNYSGPGRFRGVGGIATGALGALQNWSGMWRFAWSHGRAGVEKPETKILSYFDMSGDPLGLAAERAALCLFLRRDLSPLPAEYPLVLEEVALRDPRNGAPNCEIPNALWVGWHARVGSIVEPTHALNAASPLKSPPKEAISRPVGDKFGTLRTSVKQVQDDLAALGANELGNGAVSIDSITGTFLLNTPRTAGGFAESGSHAAGPLKFEIAGRDGPAPLDNSATNHSSLVTRHSSLSGGGNPVAATVWASSLDGKPIAESSHILLTHLTDVQNTDICYADPKLTILLKWGHLPHLMRNGAAKVELSLKREAHLPPQGGLSGEAALNGGKSAWRIYRLSPSGRRLGEVPYTSGGSRPLGESKGDGAGYSTISFTARTDLDPSTATYLYEIVQEPAD